MEFDARQTLLIAVLVLFLGRYLNKKIKFLKAYNIPEPVTGGIIASICFSIFYFIFGETIKFALQERDVLLIVFFTCVGLSAKFSTLITGGKALITVLVLAVCYLILQNITIKIIHQMFRTKKRRSYARCLSSKWVGNSSPRGLGGCGTRGAGGSGAGGNTGIRWVGGPGSKLGPAGGGYPS